MSLKISPVKLIIWSHSELKNKWPTVNFPTTIPSDLHVGSENESTRIVPKPKNTPLTCVVHPNKISCET